MTYPSRSKEYQRNWAREWRRKNPDKVRAINHSEANKRRQAKYRATHKEEISKRNIAYAKRKRMTDIRAKIMWLLRARTQIAIKRQLGKKAYKTIELLGCSIQEARQYIEKQFRDGMTWENHGKIWEIDHIIPLGSFNLTDPIEQKKAFHYTNLQPLNCKENRQKQPKRKLMI